MTVSVTTGNLLNPSAQGLSYGMFPAGSMSQYLDAYSVFSNNSSFGMNPMFGMGTGIGMGYGVGNASAWNNAYYGLAIQNSDNSATLTFVNRGNNQSLNSYGEIMQKELTELATALRTGQMGKASRIYDSIYSAIGQNYGRELGVHADRVNFDKSVKATITNLYQQVNGYPLANDINDNGEGYFANGFLQGLTLGNHHKNSAEETESYMTGTEIEGYGSKKFAKNVGRVIGGGISVGAAAGIGAAIGANFFGIGAVPGAVIGGGIALLTSFINGNDTTKITRA